MTKLSGCASHPITRGFACAKMVKYPQRQEHKDRLLYPQRRIGDKGAGRFERITWDEAFDIVVAKLKQNVEQYGEQSVLPFSYAGTMGLIERDHPLAFFRALGACELDWTICASTGGAGWEANYGPEKLSTAPEDIEHSQFIVLWGINVLRSNSHLVPWLRLAQRRGTKIVHIDPYRNETSRFADKHLQIAVGTDAALALAIGREILAQGNEDSVYLAAHANSLDSYRAACEAWPIERAAEFCGLPAADIQQLAKDIGENKATFIKVGYGMTRNEGGGNAMRAITLLPALTGAWTHRGGGAALSTSGAFPLNRKRYSGLHLVKPNRRVVNQNKLGEALNNQGQPISTLFVFNSNPAAVAPNSTEVLRGLRREDLFTVVMEHFQTDTADYADILLPATTFLEHPDLYTAYGHYHLQWAEPVTEARGECQPNSWFFKRLAERMNFQDPVFAMTTPELAQDLLDSTHAFMEGISWEKLRQERSLRLNLPSPFLPYSDGSRFADRKIRFDPAPQQVEFTEKPTAEFPLRLISPPGPFILNTSMGNIEEIIRAAGGEPTVLIHPINARHAGIEHESPIRITSEDGSIVRKALVTDDAREGVLIAVGQWWPKLSPDKQSLNNLTSQRLTDLGGGSLFGNAVVRVEPA